MKLNRNEIMKIIPHRDPTVSYTHLMDMENWNPNGGAIAFGHPNGASGARICIFTMKELIRRGGKYGMFSSCCGGGLGVSALIENLRR